MSGHISPGLLLEINHKYFNIYGSVHGSDCQGTGTGLLRTGPKVRSKVRYMVRTELRVQFSVLQISLWTWPNRTLTTLILMGSAWSVHAVSHMGGGGGWYTSHAALFGGGLTVSMAACTISCVQTSLSPSVRIPATSYLVALFTLIYTILLHLLLSHTECILLSNNRKGSCSGWLEL